MTKTIPTVTCNSQKERILKEFHQCPTEIMKYIFSVGENMLNHYKGCKRLQEKYYSEDAISKDHILDGIMQNVSWSDKLYFLENCCNYEKSDDWTMQTLMFDISKACTDLVIWIGGIYGERLIAEAEGNE